MYKKRICRVCGVEFQPTSSRQVDCNKIITRACEICGKQYETQCSLNYMKHTCSIECQKKYVRKMQVEGLHKKERTCKLCGKSFVPDSGGQMYCNSIHTRKCVVCGKEFILNTHTNIAVSQLPVTCSKKCADVLRFKDGNPFSSESSRKKARETYLKKTGYDHPMHNPEIVSAMQGTYMQKTGYIHPSHNPEVRNKSIKHSKVSSLESRVARLLDEYGISYTQHYMLSDGKYSHEYDFHVPDYHLFIDCDGVYYHSYLDDPDGNHVLDYYDEDRIALIPEDSRFHVIVEGQEDRDIKYLFDVLKTYDPDMITYDTELFKWCRSIDFPYPNYSEKRLKDSFEKLKKYTYIEKYNPASRIGDCIIKQFHKSIWDSRVFGYPSVREAWYDDNLLKKVIANRLIYRNNVDPSKILSGFNVSKICPRVSIFNPVLAKYISSIYLCEFDTVFDPFSGFSGRMLGVVGSGRKYIGRDNNENAVKESNEIIDFLGISDMSTVEVKNTFEDRDSSYPCLFTCPPYGKKELYSDETVFYDCDDWISYILDKYSCERYVFVVDETRRYSSYVVETIRSTSHFSDVKEYIVVI